MQLNEELRAELLLMAAEDNNTRDELLHSGKLPRHRYSEKMKEVHQRNNARMRQIIDCYGWTGRSMVGEDGCEAAWLIVQHAVLEPDFQSRCLSLLEAAVAAREAPGWQLAYLKDRVLMAEGKAQVYGTQYVPGADGKSVLWKIADAESVVDVRRREAGLPSLEENQKRIHQEDELLNATR